MGCLSALGGAKQDHPRQLDAIPSSRGVELMSRRYTPYKMFRFMEKLDSLLFNEEGVVGLQQQDRP